MHFPTILTVMCSELLPFIPSIDQFRAQSWSEFQCYLSVQMLQLHLDAVLSVPEYSSDAVDSNSTSSAISNITRVGRMPNGQTISFEPSERQHQIPVAARLANPLPILSSTMALDLKLSPCTYCVYKQRYSFSHTLAVCPFQSEDEWRRFTKHSRILPCVAEYGHGFHDEYCENGRSRMLVPPTNRHAARLNVSECLNLTEPTSKCPESVLEQMPLRFCKPKAAFPPTIEGRNAWNYDPDDAFGALQPHPFLDPVDKLTRTSSSWQPKPFVSPPEVPPDWSSSSSTIPSSTPAETSSSSNCSSSSVPSSTSLFTVPPPSCVSSHHVVKAKNVRLVRPLPPTHDEPSRSKRPCSDPSSTSSSSLSSCSSSSSFSSSNGDLLPLPSIFKEALPVTSTPSSSDVIDVDRTPTFSSSLNSSVPSRLPLGALYRQPLNVLDIPSIFKYPLPINNDTSSSTTAIDVDATSLFLIPDSPRSFRGTAKDPPFSVFAAVTALCAGAVAAAAAASCSSVSSSSTPSAYSIFSRPDTFIEAFRRRTVNKYPHIQCKFCHQRGHYRHECVESPSFCVDNVYHALKRRDVAGNRLIPLLRECILTGVRFLRERPKFYDSLSEKDIATLSSVFDKNNAPYPAWF